MLAQGNALGLGARQLGRALKGRRNPPPLQGGLEYLGTIPGALPRASYLRAVGAATRPRFQVGKTALTETRLPRVAEQNKIGGPAGSVRNVESRESGDLR